jgi:hypothetical protein
MADVVRHIQLIDGCQHIHNSQPIFRSLRFAL